MIKSRHESDGRVISNVRGDRRVAYSVTVEKRERNRTLGRTSCRWEDNIKLELSKSGFESISWNDLSRDRGR